MVSVHVNAEYIINERVGYAKGLNSDELIYTESHFEKFLNNKIISDRVTYKNAAGEIIAVKDVDYTQGSIMPSFSLTNYDTGHIERVSRSGEELIIEFAESKEAETKSKSIPLPENGIIDAGFDQFVIEHWQEIIKGERLVRKLLIPSMKKFIDFRIYQKELDQENKKRILHIEPDSLVFRVLTKVTQLEYDIDKPVLLLFKGTSNMRDARGDNLEVRIDFPRQEQLARKE